MKFRYIQLKQFSKRLKRVLSTSRKRRFHQRVAADIVSGEILLKASSLSRSLSVTKLTSWCCFNQNLIIGGETRCNSAIAKKTVQYLLDQVNTQRYVLFWKIDINNEIICMCWYQIGNYACQHHLFIENSNRSRRYYRRSCLPCWKESQSKISCTINTTPAGNNNRSTTESWKEQITVLNANLNNQLNTEMWWNVCQEISGRRRELCKCKVLVK